MATPIMIVGESGTGKSTSMRNLSPESTAIIQVINKPLPFKNNFKRRSQSNPQGTLMVTDSADLISKAILGFSKHGIQNIIIDDFQYLMANEFMKRSEEKGFQKFTDIAKNAWSVIMTAQSVPENSNIYFMTHSQVDDSGVTKAKTIGKLLDEKISLEGLFTMVLGSYRDNDGNYQLRTQNNGSNTVKSPLGMFDSESIDNDLQQVSLKIHQYYGE
tara:strand:- start:1440 stop:2087 length:648 start_codon:yes stop_codon:yes gene_type:complete